MEILKGKPTAVFSRSFVVVGFDGVLPAGEYDCEAELEAPAGFPSPDRWRASVLIHLHPRATSPGLAQTLTIPLDELDRALANDKLSGRPLADFFLEEMLADPMVRLFMRSDGASEADLRWIYFGSHGRLPMSNELGHATPNHRGKRGLAELIAIETAENEGMPGPA